ncbi:hypothetical protein RER_08160 [Rhodococcus erythropolis PR4]|uniref:Uncharacterized protein n=1 Tax=Rhodococcus erythropolis (strain PR4 / NBRC 100887) TaxID=234621 RepID=C0ZQ46_RHOE4|nr:hypothetical protein RER_08160 [Rhodococcus erythropolis PR4]
MAALTGACITHETNLAHKAVFTDDDKGTRTPMFLTVRNAELQSNASAESTLCIEHRPIRLPSLALPVRRTNELGADAKKEFKNVKARDIMDRAGVLRPDGQPKKATIRVRGGVSVRNGSEESYDYRVRTLDFANSESPFSLDETRELAVALANDDHDRGVATLGRHATIDYPENKASIDTTTPSDSTSIPSNPCTFADRWPGSETY